MLNKTIENIIFHCSDSRWGDVAEITKWHLQRGFKSCGYNGVILNGLRKFNSKYNPDEDGLFEEGRSLDFSAYIEQDEVASHTLGYNANSIGICMIGTNKFTVKQFQVALAVARVFRAVNPKIKIFGHYEMPTANGKTCPNFDMNIFRKMLDDENLTGPVIEMAMQKFL